jgi:hypothetical protein
VAIPEALAPDAVLLRRCLTGDPKAWQALYRHHQPRLLRYVDRLLWPCPGDRIEEAAACLWCALLLGGGRLGRSRAARLRLARLLDFVARQQLRRLFRAALRPERALSQRTLGSIGSPTDDLVPGPAFWAEFVGTLTPDEQRFYRERLLSPPGERDVPLGGRGEVLRRIRAKFLRYLADG